jgi:hypothetical protein
MSEKDPNKIVDNTGDETLERSDMLGDNVALEPSPFFPGKSAAVAEKDGNQICWNCFRMLIPGDFADYAMGHSIVRVCRDRECARKVQDANMKRDRMEAAGKIIEHG